jgi:hypothetical protein
MNGNVMRRYAELDESQQPHIVIGLDFGKCWTPTA